MKKALSLLFGLYSFALFSQTEIVNLGGGLFQIVDTIEANYPREITYQAPTDSLGVALYYYTLANKSYAKELRTALEADEYNRLGNSYRLLHDRFSPGNLYREKQLARADSLFIGSFGFRDDSGTVSLTSVDGFRLKNRGGDNILLILEIRNNRYLKIRRVIDGATFLLYSKDGITFKGRSETTGEVAYFRKL